MRGTVQKHSQAKASPTAGPQQGVPTVTEREPSSLSLSLMIAPLVRSPDGRRGTSLGGRGCLRVVLKGPCMTASGYFRSRPTNLRCRVGFRELLLLSDHVSRHPALALKARYQGRITFSGIRCCVLKALFVLTKCSCAVALVLLSCY